MGRILFVAALLSGLTSHRAWAPPLGAAQHHNARHAAMQEIAPLARRYHITTTLAASIVRAADDAGIPHYLAFRLVKAESNFDSLAVSATGALGLTQVLPSTGRDACPGADLLRAQSNLECGFKYFKMMHQRYGDWFVATFAYNMGPAVADTSRTLNDLQYSHRVMGDY